MKCKMAKKLKSVKTQQLMDLLAGTGPANTVVNPLMDKDFKERVIHVKAQNNEDSVGGVNVTAQVVRAWAPEALRRFRCCSCPACLAKLEAKALNCLPPYYMPVSNEEDKAALKAEMAARKDEVLRILVRLALSNRNKRCAFQSRPRNV